MPLTPVEQTVLTCQPDLQAAPNCDAVIGGVARVYIIPAPIKWVNWATFTREITAMSLAPRPTLTLPIAQEITIVEGSAMFTETRTVTEVGINYTQTLSGSLSKFEADRRLVWLKWAGKRVCAIIEDLNGRQYIMGLTRLVQITPFSSQSGGVASDFAGYQFQLAGLEASPAPFIASNFPNQFTVVTNYA